MLRGHNHPLVGVKCLPDTPQIVSVDISGMIKVWDVRNFLCVQTFNVAVEELTSFCLTYSKNSNSQLKKRIVCGSKKLHFFEYDEPKDQFLTDEKYSIKIIFNQEFLCFITMHSDCLKVWDAKTGKLNSVFRGLN
jgi:WD40 repeat protein